MDITCLNLMRPLLQEQQQKKKWAWLPVGLLGAAAALLLIRRRQKGAGVGCLDEKWLREHGYRQGQLGDDPLNGAY